ncbi:hypothetical protein CHS0354_034804 [Potamilus streckersoni]|uniref:Autocrine motility factor receptor n=1 Tax=Potamilus streckersoni TaxID=2493646 RepID=A0AAE0RSU2_9BIVA|nr:hypothetical protein CHS0354_034804 [Potamilus streckersoni]
MPVVLLERIPLPSLKTYTGFCVALLASALFYAHRFVTSFETDLVTNVQLFSTESEPGITNSSLPYDSYAWNMLFVMTTEAWCVWTLVNTAYCCLILLGKLIQKLVFGDLRVSEQQHLKDKFWNFLFYKFIFIFGVMNVQTMEEVVMWVAWFTILGFFHLLTQLSKDRFEYLSFSPSTPRFVHVKLLSLLMAILLSCCGLMSLCVYIGLQAGITIFAFMAAECMLLALRAFYVAVRYAIHLIDMNLEGIWENRSIYVYFTELTFELAVLSVDFAHHLHMLLWGNIFLSMASLVICMQLRYLFYEFQRRIKRHKNYRRVVKNMEARFPMATQEEIKKNSDDCAICWEKMESARKLPCGHLFHNSCLRSWLEQDTSCPTCRTTLSDRPAEDSARNVPDGHGGDADVNLQQQNNPNAQTTNHFFHFDGSRYVSWFPSFSVEVTHTQLLPRTRQSVQQTSQLDNMARQVLQVFPHMPLNLVLDDLRETRSVEFTIENILEGRLQAPLPGSLLSRNGLLVEESDEETPQVTSLITGAAAMSASSSPAELHQNFADDNQTELRRDDGPAQFSSRFSKSAIERETMLQERKNSMLEQARRRYLTNQSASGSSNIDTTAAGSETVPSSETWQQFTNDPDSSSNDTQTSSSEYLRYCRELAFQAAQRRIHEQRNA